jgi:hypothetical protein
MAPASNTRSTKTASSATSVSTRPATATAGYSLPFLGADAFDRFWNAVRDRLRPGGILVVNFFGPRDSWAGREGMRFIDVDAVRRLVNGLELLALEEEDQDGSSFLGPKHWHVFDVIARRAPGPTG